MGILASGQPEGNAAAKALGQPTADQQREKARKKQEESIAKDGKAFKNEDERQAALRFQEQCHLMLKWEEFTSLNGVEDPFLQQSRQTFYKNFVTIDHDTPFDFVNRLFHKGPDADVLFNLRNDQLSMLVPQVRIFKIYVDPATKEEHPVELPFDDFLSRQEVANITKTTRGRGRGVGLKNFSWKTVGKTPANNFQFEANMTLHFQSIEDIFVTRDSKSVQFAASRKTVDVSFSDLLIPKTQFRKGANDGPRVWDPSYFKIKAVVGWKVPNLRGVNAFIPERARDVLKRTHISFILTIFEHDIDVRDDGSVDLSIRFTTLPELLISEPLQANVLFPSSETKLEIERLVDKVTRLEFEIENQTDVGQIRDEDNQETVDVTQTGQSGTLSGTPEGNGILNRKKEELKQALDQLAVFDNSKKTQAYRRILGGLYNKGRLKFAEVPKEFLERQIRLKNAADKTDGLAQIQANTAVKNAEGATGDAGVQAALSNLVNSNEAGGTNQFAAALNDISQFDSKELDRTQHRIIYFYFGDLLDVVLEGMFKKKNSKPDNFDNKEVKVLLGPMTFYDYGHLEDHGLVDKREGVTNEVVGEDRVFTGKLSSVSLADIPISLKVFTNWFNEKVVNPGLESYTFHSFVSDCLNDLIIRAINTECYDFAPRQGVRLTYKPFTVPANKKRTELFKSSTRVNLFEIEEVPFIHEESRALSEKQEFENYILIHASVDHPWDLTGDYEEDRKRGIYHLFYGNERGMVKRINFKRADKPYIRAANIANNFNESARSAKVLRQVYNAGVEMFGNNLFSVGSQLRIVPSFAGGSTTLQSQPGTGAQQQNQPRLVDLVDDLGIGGYFLVLDREDRVESGLYQTDLNVVWVAPATKKKGGRISFGDKEVSIPVSRRKKKVKSGKANNEDSQATGGDISDNSAVDKASIRLGQAERNNRGGGRRF